VQAEKKLAALFHLPAVCMAAGPGAAATELHGRRANEDGLRENKDSDMRAPETSNDNATENKDAATGFCFHFKL
jgi:hypothetical protein